MISHHTHGLGFSLAAVIVFASVQTLAAEPTAVPAPNLRPGDSWVYERTIERGTSNFTSQRFDFKIEHVGDDSMVIGIKLDGSPTDFEDHVVGAD